MRINLRATVLKFSRQVIEEKVAVMAELFVTWPKARWHDVWPELYRQLLFSLLESEAWVSRAELDLRILKALRQPSFRRFMPGEENYITSTTVERRLPGWGPRGEKWLAVRDQAGLMWTRHRSSALNRYRGVLRRAQAPSKLK